MEKERKGRVFTLGVVTGLFISSIIVMLAVLCMRLQGEAIPEFTARPKGDTTEVQESVVNDATMNKIGALEKMIYDYYYEDVDEATLEKGLYYGLMSAMGDPYTAYYTPEEMAELTSGLQGIYFGIGAYLSLNYDTGYAQIDSVMPGTPAEISGLQGGDSIRKIDGQEAYGMSLNEVVSLVRGEEGTEVVLTVDRGGKSLDIPVKRAQIETPTVSYEMLDNGIVHLTIKEFDDVTVAQYEAKMNEIMALNPKGIIMDLRGNPGGSLECVTAIARQILPKGMIVYTEDKYGKKVEYTCDGEKQLQLPLVVLADGNSASASEILVGAIKDYGVGTVVGTKTFGKGIVQKIFPMNDGSALKITVSNYFTPNGTNIHGVGIEPDIEVEFDSDAYLKDKTDNQLQKAIEVMNEKISQ